MSSEPIVRIDIATFRRLGYLQELNRRFLHPLGLALEVVVEDDGTERLGGIWDYRTDPEGMRFGDLNGVDERERAIYVAKRWAERAATRRDELGYVIQPIEGEDWQDPEPFEELARELARAQAAGGYVELYAEPSTIAIDVTDLAVSPELHRALIRAGVKPVAP